MIRRIVSRLAAVVGPLLAAAFALLPISPVGAHVPPFDPLWLWPDLAPGGSHHITYDLCDPVDVPVEWSTAVENWDIAMGSLVEFEPVFSQSCQSSFSAQVRLQWEYPGHECPDDDWWGCLDAVEWQNISGSEGAFFKARILFDYDHLTNDANWQGRVALSAHEWGHILSLDEHSGDMCDNPHRIMAYVDVGNQSCQMGPSTEEWQTVRDFYNMLGPPDPDGDAFTDAVELYVGTDRWDRCPDNRSDNAWPLDHNNDRAITAPGDINRYSGKIGTVDLTSPSSRRLDLNADGAITAPGDIYKYVGKIAKTCYN